MGQGDCPQLGRGPGVSPSPEQRVRGLHFTWTEGQGLCPHLSRASGISLSPLQRVKVFSPEPWVSSLTLMWTKVWGSHPQPKGQGPILSWAKGQFGGSGSLRWNSEGAWGGGSRSDGARPENPIPELTRHRQQSPSICTFIFCFLGWFSLSWAPPWLH